MNALAQVHPAQQVVDTRYTQDVIPVLDTSKFEHMQRIAMVMAKSSIIPESLRKVKVDKTEVELPEEVVIANCFRIVNQAVRWGMDPFAVADCASIVHGRLMWEGKLIAAVLDAKLGVKLKYTFTNEDAPPTTRKLGVVVSAYLPGEADIRTIEGTVQDWHKGDKSPWSDPGANGNKWKRQLRYMGAREWARAHAPAVMLGVYTEEEFDGLMSRDVPSGQRAVRLKDVTPKPAPVLELPDIPDVPTEAPAETPSDDTEDARSAIQQAISLEMLNHIRDAYADADWPALEAEYEAKREELQARAA